MDERVDDPLGAWQMGRAGGRDIPAANLCRDCPEFLSAVDRELPLVAGAAPPTVTLPEGPAAGSAGTG